jgi:outer membrane receptor protein involved in Fe transport
MVGRRIGRALRIASLVAAVALLLAPGTGLCGTTGKIAGRILDKQKQPLPGANVILIGVQLGAATDGEGRYTIINIPAGKYQVKISLIGYQAVTVTDITVSSDKTTKLDIELAESAVALAEIVVSAKRPVVEVDLTSSVATVTRDEIANLPVQELAEIVNLQAGVIDGHFRGGRLGEVQYQVDGVTVNNVFNNASTLRLDRSLLEEVQVISGTFDAEYGQAMSGVVNAVLRRGTEKFTWDAEVLAGGFVYPGGNDRIVVPATGELFPSRTDPLGPGSLQNYQLSVSGPAYLPKTFFLISGRRYLFNDYVEGIRRFLPTDTSDFENKVYYPTGDGKKEALGYTRESSGVLKLTNRSLSSIEMNYEAVLNVIDGRRTNYAFRFNPDGLTKQHTFSIFHGLDWTHTLTKSTFYNVSVRQNYLDYNDLAYEDVFDPRYDAAGPPTNDPNYEPGANIQGVDFTRFRQSTDAVVLKSSFVSQMTPDQQLKLGAEFQVPKLQFGTPGHLVYTVESGRETLVRHINKPPDYPGIRTYFPILAAAFGQEEIEWNDLTIRAGGRFEYFDARSTIPSDLANPANSITGAPPSPPKSSTPKFSLAPRLGVSYPITHKAAIFFAYGHFYQLPALGEIFANADYSRLSDLQAGGISYGVLGNPDIKPEQTVQYQFGYKHALADYLGLDVNVFYKDIRDLLGVEFVSTYNGAEYARLTNVDFGNVIGLTVALDQRALGLVSTTMDYTWQVAQGNSSDPRETATRASAGEDPRPRQVALGWDQRHTFNLTVLLSRPNDFSASAILRVGSGQPYTPMIETGFGGGLETNSGRKPNATVVDLRGEKRLKLGGLGISAFGRIFNLFDSKFFNGFVFSSSGSPLYSRYPEVDRIQLADPTRLYAPRRIELGISMSSAR